MSFVPPATFVLPAPPNPHPLPYLRRLCHLRPPPYLPTQSAFIRVIRLIRDSDSDPRPPHYLRFPSLDQDLQDLGVG